jgi:serine/threonine protein kinase
MQSQFDQYLFTALDREHFENIQNYKPTGELIDVVRRELPSNWLIESKGTWTHCGSNDHSIPAQGWKIHISATILTAVETLKRIVPIFVAEQVAFKFASDLKITEMMNSKNWHRAGSGKFITVYPTDEQHFRSVIERCHAATRDLQGPFILSDRRYKDSKVVFYRYGGFKATRSVNVFGESVPSIVSPQGQVIPDERTPYFNPPAWVTDPFEEPSLSDSGESTEESLLNHRYLVTGAIKFSNKGGIYEAEDKLTGKKVLIREARPLVGKRPDERDVQYILEKEARILKKLEHTGFTPKFIDLFEEWEHLFLVEEFLEGQSLFNHSLTKTLGYLYHQELTTTEYYEAVYDLVQNLVNALRVVHEQGIVLRDLTKGNILVTPDHKVKLIDFEMAYDISEGILVAGFTPGFASPQQLQNSQPSFVDDYYSLGALIYDFIFFNVQYLMLNREGASIMLDGLLKKTDLPEALKDVILGLMHEDTEKRWAPAQALHALEDGRTALHQQGGSPGRLPAVEQSTDDLRGNIESTLQGVTRYILSKADFNRSDRLWPSNPRIFYTNPVSLLYGASGTAFYLHKVAGVVPDDVKEWLVQKLDKNDYAPGLYGGLAGVAWFLLDAGLTDKAHEILAKSEKPELITAVPDIMYGAAGWGLTNLYFWWRTKEENYLKRALAIGEHLLKTAKHTETGLYWENDGNVYYGYAHGASGIASFLLYLHLADGSPRFLDAARKALDFEIGRGIVAGEKILWERSQNNSDGSKHPHWRIGTAGVGQALIRFHMATGEERYRRYAEMCAETCGLPHSNKIWQLYGLSGFGELQLDMYQFLGDKKYLDRAYRLAEAILSYRIEKPEGIAFPGIEMLRISCDYGTGMAGVGLYLHRAINSHTPRLLTIDDLLRKGQ